MSEYPKHIYGRISKAQAVSDACAFLIFSETVIKHCHPFCDMIYLSKGKCLQADKSMIGAIIGDVVGSRFEWNNHRSRDFELFHADCRCTDDSILTIAVMKALSINAALLNRSNSVKTFVVSMGQRFRAAITLER